MEPNIVDALISDVLKANDEDDANRVLQAGLALVAFGLKALDSIATSLETLASPSTETAQ